jgi:hypothetical protein
MSRPPRTPSKYALALLPHKDLTPAACNALAVALDEARETLRSWNIRLPETGRLEMAARQLRRIADQNHYGASIEELHLSAQAIFLANDFYTITRTLRADRLEPIARELIRALAGTLQQDSLDRRAYEMQSQFWFGTLLAYSELHPMVPDTSGKRPDFVITIEEVRLAVEVKRPSTFATAHVLVDSADEQIRGYGRPGIVVVDLSEAIGTELLLDRESSSQGRTRVSDAVRPVFTKYADELKTYIRRRQPTDYSSIVGLIVYTRFCVWEDPTANRLDFGFLLNGQVLPLACGGLMEHFAERTMDRLAPGVKRLTGNPLDQYQRPERGRMGGMRPHRWRRSGFRERPERLRAGPRTVS